MSWIGVDLDGTLAKYDGYKGADQIGEPVPVMLERVKEWLERNYEVRIFTARVYPIPIVSVEQDLHCYLGRQETALAGESAFHIQKWCKKHLRKVLPITCQKDYAMIELWDDRCVRVEMNTGKILSQTL